MERKYGKKQETNIIIKKVKKKLLSIILLIQKFLREDAGSKYRNLSEKQKEKKRKYQRDRYHMNIDLNERLKQHQRNYLASKKIRK